MMKNWLGIVLVAVSAMGFGLMSSLERLAHQNGVNLLTLLSLRFLIAFLVMILIGIATRVSFRLQVRDVTVLALMGVFGYAAMAFLLFSSYQHLPASIATIIFYTYPLLTYILSILFHREEFKIRKASLYMVCLGGLMVSVYSGGRITVIGILLSFSAGLIYSIFILVSESLIRNVSSLVSSAIICLTSGITLLVIGLFKHQVSTHINFNGWLIILALSMLSTVVPIVFFFNGIKMIGATKGALISTIEPITSIVLSLFLFHDFLTITQMVGVLVVLASTMATQYKPLMQ
jgi:drug/metabolite transporter (DMT)-like permease